MSIPERIAQLGLGLTQGHRRNGQGGYPRYMLLILSLSLPEHLKVTTLRALSIRS